MQMRLVDLLAADCVPDEDKKIIDKEIIGGMNAVTKMSQVGRLYHLQKNTDFPKDHFELCRRFAFGVVDEKEEKKREKKRKEILAKRA